MDTTANKGNSLLDQIKEKYLHQLVTDSRSAAGNWLQLTLENITTGDATISLTVRKEMTNPYGHIHGGMMTLIMDETIGWAVVSLEAPNHYTSLNLNIDFLYAIKQGEKLFSRAHIVRQGKKIVHAECHISDTQGRILAKGSSNLVVTGMAIAE